MLLGDLAATSETLTSTSARNEKVAVLADVLSRTAPGEAAIAVGALTGEPRQGRIGIGWATLSRVRDLPPAATPRLTLTDLDVALDRIAATVGPGSQASRDVQLRDLFSAATGREAGFLTRLLLGDLRQGALGGVMVTAIARAAGVPVSMVRRALMLSGDLGETAELALRGGRSALEAVGLHIFRPVQPMLAATADTPGSAVDELGLVSVEWKLDGARVQVHRDGDRIAVFTRNLNDVTERLPEVVEAARGLDVGRAVLDGEVLGVDQAGLPHAFQDTMSGFGREDHTARSVVLVPYFFDLLHADGDDFLDLPLSERRRALHAVAGSSTVPGIETADPRVADAFLRDAIEAGHEGVMVKDLQSPYAAGRRGSAWRKVKPVHTLDLVVLAAEWGHGRRRGFLSNLHLGARDPATGGFVMVGKTFKGLTDAMLEWQTSHLRHIAVAEDGIVVHVRPELVVEIALDGAQSSSRYPGGVALRFARVRAHRPDKRPEDADTLDAVQALLP